MNGGENIEGDWTFCIIIDPLILNFSLLNVLSLRHIYVEKGGKHHLFLYTL